MTKKVLAFLLSFYFCITPWSFEAKAENIHLPINAKAFVLMDPLSGRVLFEKNSEDKRAMASTTKIMTAIIALEKGNLKSKVKVSSRAASVGGSSFYLNSGEVLSLENMLYGLLLSSGNDAAVAIAEHIGGGTEEKFVQMMNEKALELGALNTHFNNPHGLDDPEHYTTAKDLALIARYAFSIHKFREIVKTKSKEIKEGNYPRYIFSTNRLLWEFEGADGIKTGYTGNAGKCLVASADKEDVQLLSVILGTHNHFADSCTLLDFGFNNYKLTPLISKNKYCTTVKVESGSSDEVDLMTKDDISLALMENEIVKLNLIVPKSIKAPVFKEEQIGELQVYVGRDLACSTSLIAMSNIDIKKYTYILYKFFRVWMKG
ncbi:MAG: D-alanyl-D-alanine carboxypeptidase family protein [Tepidanaerobacteraceae bacterium]|jgi:D-alanyl-D-alanine carboxypeptidase (penicillin-binding protein 5/6)